MKIENLGKTDMPVCHTDTVTVEWLNSANIETGNRSYQREKVASTKWKQSILNTIFCCLHSKIPQIHIRAIETEGGAFKFELIDGQQRVTAILDYLNGVYPLPKNFFVSDYDLSGLFVNDLRDKYPVMYERLLAYEIQCIVYENLSMIETAHLFIKVLNNNNDMKPQEMRNAVQGSLSTYIRERTRFDDIHELFTRITVTSSKNKVTKLKYFSDKFKLNGRMEVDEWLTSLIYLKMHGVKKGQSQQLLTNWVEATQSGNGEYSVRFKDRTKIDSLLNFALSLMKSVPDNKRYIMAPMTAQMMILYADELQKKYGKVTPDVYVAKFLDVYDRWSDQSLGLYKNETLVNGKPMQQFSDLFGGKNSNAIGSIFKVLDIELEKDPDGFGIIELDPKETFSRDDILRKWNEQGGKDFYTGLELDEDNLAGDHYIPRSWGIKKGGTTTYDNLVVTSRDNNLKKGNRHGDEFMQELRVA